jgi:3'-phosphoadenosine 5'-phosphosulfate sulfotransferase (PAPS reductase)/FAD synthetase
MNKVELSLARIKEFEPMALMNDMAGYYVCISGGKDSSVIQELCIMAGVRCEFVHNHTSVDHPETVRFVRGEKARLESTGHIFRIEIPRFRDGRQKPCGTA